MDRSVLDTVKDTLSNVFQSILDVLKKYKKYIFLILLILLIAFGVIKLLEHLKEEKGKVYLSDKIKAELNCEETGNCVYTSNTSTQNYVWYSGFLWRVVKINKDGSIKLILNESVGVVNHFNGLNNDYVESFIRLWLNEGVFLNGLNSPDTFLVDYNFCHGDEAVECNDTIKDKVGLLTYGEYEEAGGKNSYLNIGIPFWTMTKKKESDKESYIIDANGELQYVSTSEYYQIRPVINLKSNTMIVTTTKGTKDNPYVLKGDEALERNNYLNKRYTGEYIKFAGKIWRIGETHEKYTKLVLYGKDTKMAYGVKSDIYNENDNTIKTYLNNVYYNILKGALPEIDKYLTTGHLYGGILNKGDAYTNTKIDVDRYRNNTDKLGILSLGELFSGNDLNLSDEEITWTMTPNGSEEKEIWMSNGQKDVYTAEHAIRPIIYLKSDVYVIGGSGDGRTRETAYEIRIK